MVRYVFLTYMLVSDREQPQARESGFREVHEGSTQEAAWLRAFCYGGLSRGPNQRMVCRALWRGASMLLKNMQSVVLRLQVADCPAHSGFCWQNLSQPPRGSSMRAIALLSTSVRLGVRSGTSMQYQMSPVMSSTVYTPQVPQAVFRAVCSVHGVMSMVLPSLHMPSSLRFGMHSNSNALKKPYVLRIRSVLDFLAISHAQSHLSAAILALQVRELN